MCKNLKVLSKVKSGELAICCECKIYHLEFNNIYLEFSEKEIEQFKTFVSDIEIAFWEEKYASAGLKRKIPIPSIQRNLVLMFNRQEIEELKTLLFFSSDTSMNHKLQVDEIDYTLILN